MGSSQAPFNGPVFSVSIDPSLGMNVKNTGWQPAGNVFVTDGAVFATQGCYEPTLTIMAISARAGEHIAQAFRRGEL